MIVSFIYFYYEKYQTYSKVKKLYNGQPYAHSLYLPLTFYYKKKNYKPIHLFTQLSSDFLTFLDTIQSILQTSVYVP